MPPRRRPQLSHGPFGPASPAGQDVIPRHGVGRHPSGNGTSSHVTGPAGIPPGTPSSGDA